MFSALKVCIWNFLDCRFPQEWPYHAVFSISRWDIAILYPKGSHEPAVLEWIVLHPKLSRMTERKEFYFQQFSSVYLKSLSIFFFKEKSIVIHYWDIFCTPCLTATCKNYAVTSVGKMQFLHCVQNTWG